jgi:tetratricopeptide (TPR) repeat protein
LDKPQEALDCFDEVLALDPEHADALVKKGAALERLQRLDEAIECYDLAIARDNSLTMAYLYKGGVFNRMERYSEALACYELALKSQQKGHAANVIID